MTPKEEQALIASLVMVVKTAHLRVEAKLSEVERERDAAYEYLTEAHRIAHSYGHETGASMVQGYLENCIRGRD